MKPAAYAQANRAPIEIRAQPPSSNGHHQIGEDLDRLDGELNGLDETITYLSEAIDETEKRLAGCLTPVGPEPTVALDKLGNGVASPRQSFSPLSESILNQVSHVDSMKARLRGLTDRLRNLHGRIEL